MEWIKDFYHSIRAEIDFWLTKRAVQKWLDQGDPETEEN
jgi:hypothetical protein